MKKTIITEDYSLQDRAQSKTDHDTLIRVETKVDALVSTVDDFKTGMLARVIKLETRADSNDVYHASIPLKDYDDIAKWSEGFRSNLKLLFTVITLVSGLVSGIIVTLIRFWLHI